MSPSKKIETIPLIASDMGNSRTLTVVRYGDPTAGRKVYCQAGLHADEAPGLAVMYYLMALLDAADAAGGIEGEIVLVPVANPIGISQWRDDLLQGRFNFFDGVNFNRKHLDLSKQVAEKVADNLAQTAAANIAAVRSAIGEVLQTVSCQDEAEQLKYTLLSLAYDADVVLDLHCDNQALLHIYTGTALWPEARDLSAQMGAAATLLAADSGVTPFDEACSRIWWTLAKNFPDYPIPPACIAATVELRGMSDVDAELSSKDAANLFLFLKRRGFIRGKTPPLPPLVNDATPLRGVDIIRADLPGVVIFQKDPGDWVQAGEAVAEIVNPLSRDDKKRAQMIFSKTDGLLFARIHDRFARPGRVIAKVAGKTPLREKGENLLTL
jgi:predicted deacylase